MQDIIDRARRNNPERAAQLDEIAEIRRKKARAGWAVCIALALASPLLALFPVGAVLAGVVLLAMLFGYFTQCDNDIREINRDAPPIVTNY